MPQNASPDPLTLLRRSWAAVLAGGVLGAAVVGGGASVLPKEWTSAAVVRIVQQANDPAGAGGSAPPGEDPARVLATQRAAVLSDDVVERTAAALQISPDDVRGATTVTADTVADTLTIAAKADSAAAAQNLARTVTETYVGINRSAGQDRLSAQVRDNDQLLTTLQARAGDPTLPAFQRSSAATQYQELQRTQTALVAARDSYSGIASVISQARLPLAPSSLSPKAGGVIGLVLGLLVAAALALLRAGRRQRLTWVSDIVATAQLPLLAEVPFSRRLVGAPGRLLPEQDPDAKVVEAARGLAVALTSTGSLGSVLITSTGRYDGKSAVASQLAVACARAGLRTVLIAADVRAPAEVVGLEATAVGLTNLLQDGDAPADDEAHKALHPTATPGLVILPVGTALAAGADLLRGPRLPRLLAALLGQADLLVVDGPAVSVPESATLAQACDAVLLCVGTHDARRAVVADSVAGLRAVSGDPLGLIVVDVEDRVRPEHSDYEVRQVAAARPARVRRSPAAAPPAAAHPQLEQAAVEQAAVEQAAVEQAAVEPDPVEPVAVEPDPVEPDPVEQDPVEQPGAEQPWHEQSSELGVEAELETEAEPLPVEEQRVPLPAAVRTEGGVEYAQGVRVTP